LQKRLWWRIRRRGVRLDPGHVDTLCQEVTGQMDARELLEQARDQLTARRVFGEPIERDGVTVVPVAAVRGGAGAGQGEREEKGWGGGWGGVAKPVGAYVIREGTVSFQPAFDVNRIVLGGQVAFIVAMLVLRSILRRRG
jgi:uncharacterized spore protein YtfJ